MTIDLIYDLFCRNYCVFLLMSDMGVSVMEYLRVVLGA